jgi:1-acyl-sn-glycerol-3-phosphate acyltransferase
VARAAVGVAFHAAFSMRVAGLEHVPPRGGALIASNHVSVLDPLAVGVAAARTGRAVHYLALAELFDDGIRGWALRRIGQVPIRRGIGDWTAVEQVAALVREGAMAGISAEGTVGDGSRLQPLHKGAARIALAASAPVVPTGVWGTQHRWPKDGLRAGRPIRPPLAVAFGRPIQARGDARSRADVRGLTDAIASGLAEATERARTLASLRALS